jgi:hypothetical protein
MMVEIFECGPRDGDICYLGDNDRLSIVVPIEPVEIWRGVDVPHPEADLTFKTVVYDVHTMVHGSHRKKIAIQPQLKAWLVKHGLIR